ncbi:MAG: hypothetical protein SVU32_07190 [Candidatus Nanohaloarchaea archaeon]|nr:hypothetical protein [Candidatus Nanohaloarchaea archaeon]
MQMSFQAGRSNVARTLACDPDILLADESTSQLDTETSAEIMALYRELAGQGQTVITVNHEQELGQNADRVIWMVDGIIEDRNTDF